jgi:hypothetical protein
MQCFWRCKSRLLLVALSVGTLRPEVRILPTPQYLEVRSDPSIATDRGVEIVLASPHSAGNAKLKLAAAWLQNALRKQSASAKVNTTGKAAGATIYLWDWSQGTNPAVRLNLLDKQTLSDTSYWGQSYVIRTDGSAVWAIGSSDQGVLWAATTIAQSLQHGPGGIQIPALYVRDYPDFQFRAAADWVLNGEVNRWSMERGQGIEAYRKLCERKLDLAFRYKINMVLIDGFGWGLKQRFSGYAELMRGLNAYARERGIHLLYGGYGASYGIAYQTGPIYEEGAYLGEVFKNRESYPDGPTYQCLGFTRGKKGVDASILGSCRSNEELNRRKGEELRQFVAAVEPGALYIHHEDFGNYRNTAQIWLKRCERCRKRWPNDSLAAEDGGAGGLANGYAALVRAINSVKNPADGYDAARDCRIILISPVYHPDSAASDDWAAALELWRNIGKLLPRSHNVEAGFREVFPQKYGGRRWTEQFNTAMRNAGLDLGMFLYFAGGADDWSSDYPLTGVPAMNALFRGATTIYNGTGDFYREPMELVSAEYSWNTRSNGFYMNPMREDETRDIWRRYIFQENQPSALFGPGKLFEQACTLLYGPQAAAPMAAYYRESVSLPDREIAGSNAASDNGYLPMGWNRIHAVLDHWRDLALDSKTWGAQISNERYAEVFARMNIDLKELHRRLARRWNAGLELNRKGAADVRNALAANPSVDSIEDLRFLETGFRVYEPLMEALANYHAGLEAYFENPRNAANAKMRLRDALAKARQVQQSVSQAFPHVVDPIGGDVGAVRHYTDLLVRSIEGMEKER